VLEALVGAIYMDKGYDTAKAFILDKIIGPYINFKKLEKEITSYKGYMIAWAQKRRLRYKYLTEYEENAQGKRIYHSRLFINGKFAGRGRAASKKKAEEIASRNAYYKLVAH